MTVNFRPLDVIPIPAHDDADLSVVRRVMEPF